MKLIIDVMADPCVFIQVTPNERALLKTESDAWRNSGIFSHLMEQAERYSRIVAWAAQGGLLPDDWNASRVLADETRLHGTVHEQVFGVTMRVRE